MKMNDPLRNDPLRQDSYTHDEEKPYVVIPNRYCSSVLKTHEASYELRRRIEEKAIAFDREIATLVDDMRRQEADVMASQKAEFVGRQLSAYVNTGLSEEKAWELVKMEVQRDAKDT